MKRLSRKAFAAGLLWGLLLLCVGGCSKKDTEGKYRIYYLSSKDSVHVESVAYDAECDETDTEGMVEEFVRELCNPPEEALLTPAGAGLSMQGISLDKDILYVNLTEAYVQTDSVTDALTLSAIVKTLIQIPDVHGIYFQMNGNALLNPDGNDIGVLTADSFVDSEGDALCGSRTDVFTLYFPDASGEKIVPVVEEVTYNSNISRQRMVIERLISGLDEKDDKGEIDGETVLFPEGIPENAREALPADTQLIDIDVSGDTCYLNFNAAFAEIDSAMTEDAVIYSIVDSITELAGVTHVRIAVEGKQNRMLREHVALSVPFEWNGDMILY